MLKLRKLVGRDSVCGDNLYGVKWSSHSVNRDPAYSLAWISGDLRSPGAYLMLLSGICPLGPYYSTLIDLCVVDGIGVRINKSKER